MPEPHPSDLTHAYDRAHAELEHARKRSDRALAQHRDAARLAGAAADALVAMFRHHHVGAVRDGDTIYRLDRDYQTGEPCILTETVPSVHRIGPVTYLSDSIDRAAATLDLTGFAATLNGST